MLHVDWTYFVPVQNLQSWRREKIESPPFALNKGWWRVEGAGVQRVGGIKEESDKGGRGDLVF